MYNPPQKKKKPLLLTLYYQNKKKKNWNKIKKYFMKKKYGFIFCMILTINRNGYGLFWVGNWMRRWLQKIIGSFKSNSLQLENISMSMVKLYRKYRLNNNDGIRLLLSSEATTQYHILFQILQYFVFSHFNLNCIFVLDRNILPFRIQSVLSWANLLKVFLKISNAGHPTEYVFRYHSSSLQSLVISFLYFFWLDVPFDGSVSCLVSNSAMFFSVFLIKFISFLLESSGVIIDYMILCESWTVWSISICLIFRSFFLLPFFVANTFDYMQMAVSYI